MTHDFRPGQRVMVNDEEGVWTVAMYADHTASGLGESVGLIREGDGRQLELGDDEFGLIVHERWWNQPFDQGTLCTRCGRPLVPGCCRTVADPAWWAEGEGDR